MSDTPLEPQQGSTAAAARALGAGCDWPGAFALLEAADARDELEPDGLELLAECARWIGRSDLVVDPLERAHQAFARAGDRRGAVRTALGLCYTHMDACEQSLAGSWWKRADELIASLPESPEHGLHAWFAGRACSDAGDIDGHAQHASRALAIAQRFGDRNIEALALVDLAHVATHRGASTEAMRHLDNATALALGGEIGVLESGFVFCNAIFASRARGEWDRAQEWTRSANRWVERVRVSYFPGLCRVHRSEVLRFRGELAAAESEAREAVRLLARGIPRWLGYGQSELGEVRRRRGDLAGATEAFRAALELGWDPQPGLALVLLAQGEARAAHGALERFCRTRAPGLVCEDRAGVLRGRVRAAIAAGELSAAEAAAAELSALAAGDPLPWDRAASAEASGELALARGDDEAAIDALGEARSIWAQLDAPYELASCCLLLGRALRAHGDRYGANLEFEAARGIFDRIGATLDRTRCDAELGSEGGPVPLRSDEAALRREGDYWSIEFGGRTLRIKDGRGPRYLAVLLAAPGQDRLALDLASGGQATVVAGDAGEVLDPEARAAYRTRLIELRIDLDDAERDHDLARAESCRIEIDTLARQLSAAIGLGGRARRAGDVNERARQSVTKAIRATIRRLGDDDEALGRYLSNTIRTGTTCRFDPDPSRSVRWAVDLGGASH